jgi:CubicO group peptidase (beta-lactamase class C family)
MGAIVMLLLSCGMNNNGNAKPSAIGAVRPLDTAEVRVYHDALAHFFDSLLLKSGFSGGILVAKNGQVLYEHYQGYADGARMVIINPETPFHVASTSKTFTSTAILQLVNLGKINLDDSVQRFFELFPYPGVTVRHLLNHSSGLPNYANFLSKYNWDKNRTATNYDVLQQLYANRPSLEFATGTAFRYSNTNFALLALIVEKASGRFYPDYVEDSIFARSGMKNSYVLNQNNPGNYIPSWDAGGRMYNFDFLDAIYGDKNVFTTCRDLMKYDSAIRNHLLLPQGYFDTAWTPYFLDKKYGDTIEHYGLGWRVKVFNDTLKIPYHNGWWHGNNAVFQRVVADTAVIIITGNRFSNRIYAAAKAANIFRPYYTKFLEEQEIEPGQSSAYKKPSAKKSGVSSKGRKSSSSKKRR